MYFVRNEQYLGPVSTWKIIDDLKATDVKFIDGDRLSHVDVVVAKDVRCYILDDILSKISSLETQRNDARKKFRSKVELYLKQLPYENGCVGKSS